MGYLTGVLYGVLAFYLGGWYLGKWTGNFSLLLFILSVVTLAYWLAERFHFAPRRLVAARALEEQDTARRTQLAAQGISKVDGDLAPARERLLMQPWWLDWTAGLFPVILAVFLLRSFLFEPFKIPSGSMIPTLLVGDFILVNKWTYGIRLPVINKKIIDVNQPQRGDVMVFRFPADPSLDYIKRVVGLPGDKVEYVDKKLTINGVEMVQSPAGDYLHPDRLYYSPSFTEKLGKVEHRIIVENDAPAGVSQITRYPFRENCTYTTRGFTCTVPAGHYFMMGDNRDGSFDSRGWGFVPEQNIVGKAFFIWFNFSDLQRIGSFH